MNRFTLLLLGALLVSLGCAPPPHEHEQQLRSAIETLVSASGVPGAAVAIVESDRPVLVAGFGYADLEEQRPFTAETQHYIASSTKSFTGLAVALLDQDGKFELDRSLSDYLPDAALADGLDPSLITVRSLLSHTHGITNSGPVVLRTAYTGEHTPDLLLDALEAHLPAESGTSFSYGNVGYNVTSMAMDHELGEPWKDVLQRLIFEPLGMKSTTGYHSLADPDRLESVYRMTPEGEPEAMPFRKFDGNMHAAGGLITTASDMALWLQAQLGLGSLDGIQVFPEAVMLETRRRQAEQESDRGAWQYDGYGLGWNLGTFHDQRLMQHNGGFPGFATHVSLLPDAGLGVAVFANESFAGSELVNLIAEYAYDTLLDRDGAEEAWAARFAEIPDLVEQLQGRLLADRERRAARSQVLPHPRSAYTGVYEHPLIGRLHVDLVDDDRFTMRLGSLETDAVEVFNAEANQFRTELTGSGTVVLFEMEGGRAVRANYFGAVLERVDG